MNATSQTTIETLSLLISKRGTLLKEAAHTPDWKSRQERLHAADLLREEIGRAWDRLAQCKGQ